MLNPNRKQRDLDLPPFIQMIGLAKFLEQVDVGEMIDAIGPKRFIEALGFEQILANVTDEKKQRLRELLK